MQFVLEYLEHENSSRNGTQILQLVGWDDIEISPKSPTTNFISNVDLISARSLKGSVTLALGHFGC